MGPCVRCVRYALPSSAKTLAGATCVYGRCTEERGRTKSCCLYWVTMAMMTASKSIAGYKEWRASREISACTGSSHDNGGKAKGPMIMTVSMEKWAAATRTAKSSTSFIIFTRRVRASGEAIMPCLYKHLGGWARMSGP